MSVFARPLILSLTLTLGIASSAGAQPGRGTEPRIVAGANVRLRAAPSVDAPITVVLPLGTSLVLNYSKQPKDTTWVLVDLSNGTEAGYIRADLTRAVPFRGRVHTIERLAIERLARTDDPFAWKVELVDMLTRVREEPMDPETAGRLALLWIQSMRSTLRSIPFRYKRAPFEGWLAERDSLVFHNDPAGEWLLRNDILQRLHGTYSTTAVADDIAWAIRENGLGGECEGSVVCVLGWMDKLDAEYLRLHPRGKHASDAVKRIIGVLDWPLTAPVDANGFLNLAKDCKAVVAATHSLRSAIAPTVVPVRDSALSMLDRIARRCEGAA